MQMIFLIFSAITGSHQIGEYKFSMGDNQMILQLPGGTTVSGARSAIRARTNQSVILFIGIHALKANITLNTHVVYTVVVVRDFLEEFKLLLKQRVNTDTTDPEERAQIIQKIQNINSGPSVRSSKDPLFSLDLSNGLSLYHDHYPDELCFVLFLDGIYCASFSKEAEVVQMTEILKNLGIRAPDKYLIFNFFHR